MKTWLRPTPDTKFSIDAEWWEKENKDIRLFVREFLCPECMETIAQDPDLDEIDWVDPDTGEVSRVDALWNSVQTCCSLRPGFIGPSTPFLESIFRTFVANGNQPLSIKELYELLDRNPPESVLRMLTAGRIYLGIRPAI